METIVRRVAGFEVACATEKGGSRAVNQDCYRILTSGVCVLDGMGSGSAGEVFSELAANRIELLFSKGETTAEEILRSADAALLRLGTDILGAPGGTMACLCEFDCKGGCQLYQVGDVRAFVIGKGRFSEIGDVWDRPNDRSFLGCGRAFIRGPSRLGASELKSSSLLLCTDGVWKFAPGRELREIACTESDPRRAAQRMVHLARQSASGDDMTVALCRPCGTESGRTRDRIGQ